MRDFRDNSSDLTHLNSGFLSPQLFLPEVYCPVDDTLFEVRPEFQYIA